MKTTKRKTEIKCPMCKVVVIGHKYPPTTAGFNCDVKMNDQTSRRHITYKEKGVVNIQMLCLKCEAAHKKERGAT